MRASALRVAGGGAALLGLLAVVPLGDRALPPGAGSRYQGAVVAGEGAVASASPDASAVGVGMLRAGGNAVDAAVATVFAVGVVAQESCGIGGGGFLLYRSADGTDAALDFRETAPAALPADFEAVPRRFRGTGHQVVGVPGTVAGMAAVAQRFGTRPLAELLQPAIALAERGVLTAPPPTAGGTMVLEALNLLEGFPLGTSGFRSGSAATCTCSPRRRRSPAPTAMRTEAIPISAEFPPGN